MSGLFGGLHEDAFLVFSRQNRHLYARVILEIYRTFFGSLHIRLAPSRAEVCDFIGQVLLENQVLWVDEEKLEGIPDKLARRGRKRRRKRAESETRDPIAMKADHIYGRLLACGWIEETQQGFQFFAEMPPAAQALAERFHELDVGLEQVLGGVIIGIRNALLALETRAEENALGLKQAVDGAISFVRRLRGIHSSLQAIERDLKGAADVRARFQTFFEDFLGKILIQDFRVILTMNHPYRFKSEIIGLADKLSFDVAVIEGAAKGYVDNRIADDMDAARNMVAIHLDQVREAFDSIDDAFQRINEFRMHLENQLRNTIQYMDRVDDRASALLARAIEAVARAEKYRRLSGMKPLAYPMAISQPAARLHEGNGEGRKGSLAVPPVPRKPIEKRALSIPKMDPYIKEVRALQARWRLMSDPDYPSVMAWLDRKLRPGETIDTRLVNVGDVEEFFKFIKLMTDLVHLGEHGDFVFEKVEGRREDQWLESGNFRITRKRKDAA